MRKYYNPSEIAPRQITADQAAALVKPGNRVYIGTGCAAPISLVEALERRRPAPADVELIYFLTSGLGHLWAERPSAYRHRCFFVGSEVRELVRTGQAEYIPISLANVPRLVENGRVRCDVAFIQTTPPDEHGFVSLGISVDVTMPMVRHANTIVAETNPRLPRTHGDSFVPVNRITHFVSVDRPLVEYDHEPVDAISERIARYVAEIIEDGATIHVDLGRISNETLKHLHHRRDLGIHSNVITQPVYDLIEQGVITGRHKNLHPGKVIASFCIGTHRFYDFLRSNAMFEMRPIDYVADPVVIAGNHCMVSLTQAFAIDLSGQVCADQFLGEYYSGVSTQIEFHRGAAASIGGKPIVCLRSTTDDGKESRIRPVLLAGEGVTLARSEVHYVVTEFGIAHLFGKSVRERATALVDIAHPDFREHLLGEAKRLGLIPAAHRLGGKHAYPVEEERTISLKSGRSILLRPARGTDVAGMKSLFHRMSAQDVYMRFFRRISSLSYEEAQRLCNVDFEQDVAFVAVTGPRDNETIVGTGAYFLNASTNMAEIAFMIDKDSQGCGLGAALQQRLKEFAIARHVRGFIAEVLQVNKGMLALAQRLGDIEIATDEGVVHVISYFTD